MFDANLGARLKYTEQYCMFNIIAATCSLGPSTACMHTSLASQRVKGTTRMHMARQLNIYTLRKVATVIGFIRRKLTSELSEEGSGGDQHRRFLQPCLKRMRVTTQMQSQPEYDTPVLTPSQLLDGMDGRAGRSGDGLQMVSRVSL